MIVSIPPSRLSTLASKDIKIDQIAAGTNHCLAKTSEGEVYSWGMGGYGCLGHQDNKDKLIPTKMQYFSQPSQFASRAPLRVDYISTGATCSYAVSNIAWNNSLFFWGITKRTNDSQLYPIMVQHLQGWRVQHVTCGISSTIVAAGQILY